MAVMQEGLGEKIAEGKTKTIYAFEGKGPLDLDSADQLGYMVHKDAITAGDGAKRDVIADKGQLSCRTTSAVFAYLASKGVPNHYVNTVDDRTMIVRRVSMIPIEWVARRWAAGSYVRRTGTEEGNRLEPLVLELFFKDDANHDPQITPEQAVEMGLCSRTEVDEGMALTERVFVLLEKAWSEQDIRLVDLKIEFGRTDVGLLLADVVDNDSWRLWPGGNRQRMLDKQVYRELDSSTEDALEDVRRRYVEVAERAEKFVNSDTAN